MPCSGCGMSGNRTLCRSCMQKLREELDGVPEDHMDTEESDS